MRVQAASTASDDVLVDPGAASSSTQQVAVAGFGRVSSPQPLTTARSHHHLPCRFSTPRGSSVPVQRRSVPARRRTPGMVPRRCGKRERGMGSISIRHHCRPAMTSYGLMAMQMAAIIVLTIIARQEQGEAGHLDRSGRLIAYCHWRERHYHGFAFVEPTGNLCLHLALYAARQATFRRRGDHVHGRRPTSQWRFPFTRGSAHDREQAVRIRQISMATDADVITSQPPRHQADRRSQTCQAHQQITRRGSAGAS